MKNINDLTTEELKNNLSNSRKLVKYLLHPNGKGATHCSMCFGKTTFGTVGHVYEGRFWAQRTNTDMVWYANLCETCQEKVKDFINSNKLEDATGVREYYVDPMGM